MSLADRIKKDNLKVFLRENHFGERVTYTPLGGTPRSVVVIVDRGPLATASEIASGISPKMTIEAANDPINGVDSSTLNLGGDTITIAYRPGTTPEAFGLHISQDRNCLDPNMLILVLR